MMVENHEERKLETDMLLNGINIPLELLDRNGCFISANNAFLELLQIPGIQKGKPCHEFMVCPLNCGYAMDETCVLTHVLKTKKPVRLSTMIGHRSFIIRANPIFDKDDEIAYFVKSYTDISEQTERIQQENVLNKCLETFFHAPDMMSGMKDVSKEICDYMEAPRLFLMKFDTGEHTAEHYFEFAGDGSEFFSEVHGHQFDPAEKWYRLFQEREAVLLDDVHAPDAADTLGSWTDFFQKSKTRSIYVAPIYVSGALWGDFGIVYEQKTKTRPELRKNVLKHASRLFGELLNREKMKRQMLDALREAQKASQAKSFFLASVSHELRTPLNAVIGFTELLRAGGTPPSESLEYLNSIGSSANALLDLVNDVLDLSKLESGKLDIVKEKTDFKQLAETILYAYRKQIENKGIQLSSHITPMPMMLIDANRMRQILINLIGNAAKFTESGEIEFRAAFRAGLPGGGQLRFTVRDTGPGIPAEDLRKLTEPFVKLSRMRGTNAANHGTGLGLAVVKKLLSIMDGKLAIESKPGKGSTFTVTVNRIEEHRNSAEPPHEKTSSATPGLPSVLLVDDVEMNLKVLYAICRKAGFTDIASAGSGEQAFRLLADRPFGLVLTDLWMPEMSGEMLAKKIRADQRFAALPVFAVTADMEAKDHFDMALFDGIVNKPVTPAKIERLIAAQTAADPATE